LSLAAYLSLTSGKLTRSALTSPMDLLGLGH